MKITLQNIENLVFMDKAVQVVLPEFSNSYKSWRMGKMNGLHSLSRKSLLDVLNNLNADCISRLESHFKGKVLVEKTDTRICKNHTFQIDEAEAKLNEMGDGFQNFSITRDAQLPPAMYGGYSRW